MYMYVLQYTVSINIFSFCYNCVPGFVQPSKRFEKPHEVKTGYDAVCIYSRDKCAS